MKPKTAPPAGTSTPVRQRTGAVSKSGDYTHFIFVSGGLKNMTYVFLYGRSPSNSLR